MGGGQQAEIGGSVGQVSLRGRAGDVEAGGRRGWSVDDRALLVTQSGGVRPRARRPRSPLRLSLEDRETISRGLAQKKTLTAIAGELGRSMSTVSQEVAGTAARTATTAVVNQLRKLPTRSSGPPPLR